jgi:hypothetical protein
VVEHLPSKDKALNSIASMKKKKKKEAAARVVHQVLSLTMAHRGHNVSPWGSHLDFLRSSSAFASLLLLIRM